MSSGHLEGGGALFSMQARWRELHQEAQQSDATTVAHAAEAARAPEPERQSALAGAGAGAPGGRRGVGRAPYVGPTDSRPYATRARPAAVSRAVPPRPKGGRAAAQGGATVVPQSPPHATPELLRKLNKVAHWAPESGVGIVLRAQKLFS